MKSFANALIDALQRIADALNASRKGWKITHQYKTPSSGCGSNRRLNRDSTSLTAKTLPPKRGREMELIDDHGRHFLLDVIVEARRRAVRDVEGANDDPVSRSTFLAAASTHYRSARLWHTRHAIWLWRLAGYRKTSPAINQGKQ